jgi:hypothetical protein
VDVKLETWGGDRGWTVKLLVDLDRRETSMLFMSGDKLVSWPTEGMVRSEGTGPLVRSAMFLSEIVSRPDGLELMYETKEQMDRVSALLAHQIRSALEGS